MSKFGLGRGLSSLFTGYEEEKPKKEVKKVEKVEKTAKIEKPARTKAVKEAVKDSTRLKDIPEAIEREDYLKEKETLSKKLMDLEKDFVPQNIEDDDKIVEIALTKIEANPNQPRKNFDRDALFELADSIKVHGVIQPILVKQKGDKYTIIAGERRFKASKLAGLKTIPAIIKGYTIKEMKEVALIENVQRQDLNPVETAFAIKHLVDNYNLEQEEIAERIGKTVSVVANYLRILRLEPEVLTMVEKGKLSFAHAKALVSIKDPEEQIKMAKKASDGKISSRDLEKIVQQMINPNKPPKIKQPVGLEIQNLVGNMQHVFGTKVSVIGSDKRGRIYIDYFNQDDLDRISALIDKLS